MEILNTTLIMFICALSILIFWWVSDFITKTIDRIEENIAKLEAIENLHSGQLEHITRVINDWTDDFQVIDELNTMSEYLKLKKDKNNEK